MKLKEERKTRSHRVRSQESGEIHEVDNGIKKEN